MDPIQKMQQHKNHFTKNDKKIYEAILNDPGEIAFKSTSGLADMCGVSQPAVTRFIQSLGYEKYQDFRSELVAYLARIDQKEGKTAHREEYFSLLFSTLDAAEGVLTPKYMTEVANYVHSFGRIFAGGHGKSFCPAKLFSIMARKLGIIATPIGRHEAKEISSLLTEKDLVIFFSVNGQPEVFKRIKQSPASLMVVSAAYTSDESLRKNDRIVCLPYLTKNAEESPISPVLFSVFAELLVSYLGKIDKK